MNQSLRNLDILKFLQNIYLAMGTLFIIFSDLESSL